MIPGDHRNPEYWRLRIRTHEWAEHQLVSFLDIPNMGRGVIRALWKVGVTTAQALIAANPEELVERLRPYGIPSCRWQEEAKRLWKEKEAARQASGGSGLSEERLPNPPDAG
jgi:hypothetical protein